MTQHKATPEQWAKMEQWARGYSTCSCLLELRDRIAALESQRETEKACIQEIYEKLDRLKVQHESNCQDSLDSSPAPAGGLVRKVAWRVAAFASKAKAGDDATPTARAAVLAVAEWLEREGIQAWAADRLREEVERG